MKPLRTERTVDPPAGWRDLAARRGTFYHDERWIRGIADCFNLPLHWLSVRSADTLVGVMALAEVPTPFQAPRLVSFPFSYAAGPLSEDDAAIPTLLEAARDLAVGRRCGLMEIKRFGECADPPPGFVRSQRYCTYRIPRVGAETELWSKLNADSTRRGIRRAERAGIEIEVGQSVDRWLEMAALQERTARRHGIPAPPRRFFSELCVGLQAVGLADLYLARTREGQTAAGVVVWKGVREWIYAFGASRAEYLRDRPNHLLLWSVLREAIAAEVTFDLGRAAPEQHGLVEFKRRWGGQPTPLAYDYWPHVGGPNAARRDRGPLAMVSRLWTHLPLPLSRIGSRLYRYLG